MGESDGMSGEEREREAERIFGSLGGLMGRIRIEGAPIIFNGEILACSDLRVITNDDGEIHLDRVVSGANARSLIVRLRTASSYRSVGVDNESWRIVAEDRTGYKNQPYLMAKILDEAFQGNSELRFYVK